MRRRDGDLMYSANIIIPQGAIVEFEVVRKEYNFQNVITVSTPEAGGGSGLVSCQKDILLQGTIPIKQWEEIQDHAAVQGESANAFINRAIREAMERDKKGGETRE